MDIEEGLRTVQHPDQSENLPQGPTVECEKKDDFHRSFGDFNGAEVSNFGGLEAGVVNIHGEVSTALLGSVTLTRFLGEISRVNAKVKKIH